MPPYGLYPIPRLHRAFNGTPQHIIYNSNDFEPKHDTYNPNDFRLKEMPSPAKRSQEPLEETPKAKGDEETRKYKQRDGSLEQTPKAKEKHEKHKKERKERKSKKKNLDLSKDVDTPREKREVTVKTPETEKAERSKRKVGDGEEQVSGEKRRSSSNRKREKHSQLEDGRSESKKKRKRESEVHTVTSTATRNNPNSEGFVIGEDLVQKVTDTMGEYPVSVLSSTKALKDVDSPKKKKRKSDGKKQTVPPNAENDPGYAREATAPIPSKLPKKSKPKDTTGVEQHSNKTPTTAVKTKATAQTDAASIPSKNPKQPASNKQTRVPIPQAGTHALASQPVPLKKDAVLVPETPPSQRSRSSNATFTATPVPFKLYQKDAVMAPPLSTPTFESSSATPKSAPTAIAKKKTPVPLPSVPNALTDANLTRHTEPLNDEPKPRPRAKGASSAAESTGSTVSIKDMFARMGKRHDPIVDATPSKGKPKQHNELTMNTFNDQFTTLQASIDFDKELTYLEAYLNWDAANADQDLPCLGKATGCTSKKEEILRLSREENINLLSSMIDSNAPDQYNPATLTLAGTRAHNAEELLMLSLRAHIPVPIGRLEGSWTLYCPKYAETHFDRYGYGQRTLTISRIAGFNDRNSYTARLKVPPRSMLYTILAFQTPPHASFRATQLQTSAEGYKMEVVFLGNGYLVLRVDLRELLQGKKMEVMEGKEDAWMEFFGVHDEAVEWWGEEMRMGSAGAGVGVVIS
ncbi:hypothetical protein DM02DRAFT_690048 [Periconia macrospinosa]|uniref:Uncharacterized protein n=1 Tax=Periconia macrospinosa TaxID=97972 RepID=A0A2V1DBQ7_9PLEO|nr:hypothetical protein DM02DRAFT_690048 [Periconia macrospinosa]